MARDPRQLVGEAGWATVPELLAEVSRGTLRTWVAAGKLVRLRPGVLAVPAAAENWRIRVAAAVHGREAVASHATALALWELMPHPLGPVHVTVDPRSSGRGPVGVVVHRAADAYPDDVGSTGSLSAPPSERWWTPGRHRGHVRRSGRR